MLTKKNYFLQSYLTLEKFVFILKYYFEKKKSPHSILGEVSQKQGKGLRKGFLFKQFSRELLSGEGEERTCPIIGQREKLIRYVVSNGD